MKFFVVSNKADPEDYGLFSCSNDTAIPSAEEFHNSSLFEIPVEDFIIEEISRDEFLSLHSLLMEELTEGKDTLYDWAPNHECFHTWFWWEPQEDETE